MSKEPIRQDNQEAIQLLDDWFDEIFDEIDDLDDEFWMEYERKLRDNPFTL